MTMLKHGTMCGEGDKCLAVHEEMMSALEGMKEIPPGTARRFAECVINVNITPWAKQNEPKPYGCKSPSNKTITISYTKSNQYGGDHQRQHRYDNVESSCNCGWNEEEVLKTLEEGYQAKQNFRALRWMETEEHGEVLLHYRRLTAGGNSTVCGIVYNRSTNKHVRKKDFEVKKKSIKKT